MKCNSLTERELRQQYKERTCECGSSVSVDHFCFEGRKEGLTFVQWIASMAVRYPHLRWMRRN